MAVTSYQGTWLQRWLVRLFTLLFALLIYWLLGFLLNDISTLPGPDYSELEKSMLDPQLQARSTQLSEQQATLNQRLGTEQSRQQILRDSTENAQTTMNQLLQFQRLSLEKEVKPTEQEQQALAESQRIFLSNQQQYQELTKQIGEIQSELRVNAEEQKSLENEMRLATQPIREEFHRRSQRHALWLAAIQLAILIPLLLIALGLFFTRRSSPFIPMYIAFAIAVGLKVLFVMHQYFPARPFKYILLLTSLAVVTRALLSLIKAIKRPAPQFLLKQCREAYEVFLCPICSYPIRRGPLKYLFWTRRSIKKMQGAVPLSVEAETPYCCPSCSTQLYEECDACHQVRHSLLPSCEHCGKTTQPADVLNVDAP
ncbi:hypothetical protein SH661x_004305 [Planctomicrobium sp. SH661]|uniref:hypothetical protein n=1 Tax=Planctomicrobium sp. SH661 TaxID=3448124 RepID=UPI003F5B02CB